MKEITKNSKMSIFKLLMDYKALLILGSTLIFISWVIQNFQESSFKSERETIMQKHEDIENLFSARRIWLESIYTHQALKNGSIERDTVYFTKVYNYIETTIATLSSINEILIKDSSHLNTVNSSLALTLFNCQQYYRKSEYGNLSNVVNFINSENQNGYNVNEKFHQSGIKERLILSNLVKNENKANRRYLILYIVGSFLIALDFIIGRKRELESLNGNNT